MLISVAALFYLANPAPVASAATGESRGVDFVLVIAGVPQDFRAQCLIVDREGGKKRIHIDGRRPRSYGLHADAVDCRVDRLDQHAGTLMVELYARNGSLPLGANSTDEAFGCVHVRSDGPWGKAYGRRCSRVTRF